ncbi:sensor histidine kinase, GAF domain-containing [Citrifermentans bemidjiense Bem]|uniref:histidine kinase n=1 Tax=Citrifermentans bemidjiense (strain ATCC BAA-1014 / DSM 16622 / JCM 12645 / Bem) TaxID=404380 RepID=B5EAB6_CITBB|nr:XrtA/PEP-CTERM system histidine kinase PrsK [Citrifermentans bemidjiense]ACH38822.1 sensor histidine kinase, GAF domain-containing [Citrifermentans bemidjiense Bem]
MALSLVAIILLLFAMLRIIRLERKSACRTLLAIPFCAVAFLEFFDFAALYQFFPEVDWKRLSLGVEALLPALWLLVSLTYARDLPERGLSRSTRLMLAGAFALVLVPVLMPGEALYYAPDFPLERMLFLTDVGYYFYVAMLVLLVVALMNLESTLVNASSEALWRVKLDIVALGSVLAVCVFYYTNALLYRSLNMELVPLRSLVSIIAALMIVYSRTHWRGTAQVKVSQAVLLKSVVLTVIAGYLLLLGSIGEGMKYFGALFPRVLALSLGFIAGMLLLLLLLSERAQRELKVFLHKHFYQSKYDYRAQWLGLTERLANFESGDGLLRLVLSAYCDIFGVRGGALFLHQDGCGWFCATGIQELEEVRVTIAADNPLIAYLRDRRWVFCSRDDNPEILEANCRWLRELKVSFAIPLFEGEALTGFIVLGEQVVPDEEYRYEDYDLMKAIARQASVAIQHQRLSEQLTQAKAMEAVGNLATFVVHDLKNLAATVSLVVENAREHLDNPEFQKDMLSSLGNTTRKMHTLIGRLRNLGESELLHMRPVDLLALARHSARQVQGRAVTVQGTPEKVIGDEEELEKVLLNLFLNAVEASEPGTQIVAEVGCADSPYLKVSDSGCGMSPLFIRNELFAPFKTTKQAGLGIGLYQCRQIVAAHGGRIEVCSVEGEGTVFTVWFPSPALGAERVITQPA